MEGKGRDKGRRSAGQRQNEKAHEKIRLEIAGNEKQGWKRVGQEQNMEGKGRDMGMDSAGQKQNRRGVWAGKGCKMAQGPHKEGEGGERQGEY